jgi:hypothetical protein
MKIYGNAVSSKRFVKEMQKTDNSGIAYIYYESNYVIQFVTLISGHICLLYIRDKQYRTFIGITCLAKCVINK